MSPERDMIREKYTIEKMWRDFSLQDIYSFHPRCRRFNEEVRESDKSDNIVSWYLSHCIVFKWTVLRPPTL